MTEIEIPFHEQFRGPLLEGVKTATSRTSRYGAPGDEFDAFSARFRLVEVFRATLAEVSSHLWREEGVASSDEFRRIWARLHPRRGYVSTDLVYVHRFERVAARTADGEGPGHEPECPRFVTGSGVCTCSARPHARRLPIAHLEDPGGTYTFPGPVARHP